MARNHTTALALYHDQVRSFQRVGADARTAWRALPVGAFRDMKEWTDGGISSERLAEMGHPYARGARIDAKGRYRDYKGGRGVSRTYLKKQGIKKRKGIAPLLPINRQSSRLHKSIDIKNGPNQPGLHIEDVGFDARRAGRSIYAVQPKGTFRVVPRGIWGANVSAWRRRNKAFLDTYKRKQRAAFT